MMDGRAGDSGTHESRNRICACSGADIPHSDYLPRSLYHLWWSDRDARVCMAEKGIDEVNVL
jgi:hypothetical protein